MKYRPEFSNDIKESRRSLSDRNDLAKLYPVLAQRQNKADVPSNNYEAKKLSWSFLMVGLLIPIPFLVGKTLVELFLHYGTKGNILFLLPAIVVSAVVATAFFVALYSSISKRLDQNGLSTPSYLVFHLSCLALISQPFYNFLLLSKNELVNHLLFASIMVAASTLLAWVVWHLMNTERITNNTKVSILIGILFACLAAAVAYLFSLKP